MKNLKFYENVAYNEKSVRVYKKTSYIQVQHVNGPCKRSIEYEITMLY